MKMALVTDSHFGCRNNSITFIDHIEQFFNNVFFPYIDVHEIKQIVHLGDLFDQRKYINFRSLNHARSCFIDPIKERKIPTDIIVGNHDTYYRNTNDINSVNELLGADNLFSIFIDPYERMYDDVKVLLVPWINSGNREKTLDMMDETDAKILFGHIEINEFDMGSGCIMDHGMDINLFKKFDQVFSGHFHKKQKGRNVRYLGAPYEITWADYNTLKGFHIFDTETKELTFIRNPYRMFHKILYDDIGTPDQVFDYKSYEDCYVKIIIRNKSKPFEFDVFMDKLEQVSPANITVVDDHMNLDKINEEDFVDQSQSTLKIIQNYVKGLDNLSVDRHQLDVLLVDLYGQAVDMDIE